MKIIESIKKLFTVHKKTDIDSGNVSLTGRKHFIGKDEKRRNDEIISVNLPYTKGNYALFYKGTSEILKTALYAIEKILNGKTKAQYYKTLIECLYIVHHINTSKNKSKLNGINSLSTSCCDNTFCLRRIKCKDSICSHCYADAQQNRQLALQDRNTINGIILRNILIPAKYWKKYFNKNGLSKFFRIESFGDIQNTLQAQNYIELSKAFPRVHFAAWTKNFMLWFTAFDKSGKPENLSFIVSSNKVNAPETEHLKNKYVNHIFTVFDKEYIKENNININCGGRACMDCIKRKCNCYFTNTEKEIREQLK